MSTPSASVDGVVDADRIRAALENLGDVPVEVIASCRTATADLGEGNTEPVPGRDAIVTWVRAADRWSATAEGRPAVAADWFGLGAATTWHDCDGHA